MNQTNQTLLEQLRITEFEIEHRKNLLNFGPHDVQRLVACKPLIEAQLDDLVACFYRTQTSEPEIALLIGDADTLTRLRSAQRRYILDLFSGNYGLEYVNNRLRIGMVHKRIGVEPKLYLAGVHTLLSLLTSTLSDTRAGIGELRLTQESLQKLIHFDVTLVFETYIRSLVTEIEIAKNKSEQYARSMEEKVRERTLQLEELSKTDPLTGLQNKRHLNETLGRVLSGAQRRREAVTVIYMDVNDFKSINDNFGHQRGDEILCSVAEAMKQVSREEDVCFRCGGDEFCVILPNSTEDSIRDTYLPRLRHAVSSSNDKPVSLSIGLAQAGPHDYCNADALLHRADEGMYREKRATKQPGTRTVSTLQAA
ncbi:MAG: GGDEF domain-containing protein [Proteobacteria bacterium]|nr:GGDEF domain-containing protein [Pseudomonadota bacterium]